MEWRAGTFRSTHRVTSPRHAGGEGPFVPVNFGVVFLLRFLLSGQLFLFGLPPAHRPSCCPNPCSDRGAFSSIAPNGSSDRSDRCTPRSPARGAALWRRRSSLLYGLVRIESGLLFGPFVTTKLILFLLLLRLALAWIHEYVCTSRHFTGQEYQTHHDADQS